jgi:hypothetical protein
MEGQGWRSRVAADGRAAYLGKYWQKNDGLCAGRNKERRQPNNQQGVKAQSAKVEPPGNTHGDLSGINRFDGRDHVF